MNNADMANGQQQTAPTNKRDSITRIIIAHRAETIASATRIIHLEKPQ